MDNWGRALMGGLNGGAKAVNTVLDERRAEERDNRKLDKTDKMQVRRDERLNEYAIEIKQMGITATSDNIKTNNIALMERTEKTQKGANDRNDANLNKPVNVGSGSDLVDPKSGEKIYGNDDRASTKTGAGSGKSSLVIMKNGEQKTEDDIREMYSQQYVSKGIDGFEKKDANAPAYMDWRNNMVNQKYQLDSSLVLDADMTTPPTEGELAIAKANLNDKASAWIPFDNDSDDDEAVAAEVYRMREEKHGQKVNKKAPLMSKPKAPGASPTQNRKIPKDGTIVTSNGKRYLVTNGRPVEIK